MNTKYEMIGSFWIDEDLKILAYKTAQSPRWYARYNVPGLGQRKQSLKTTSKKQARLNGRKLAQKLAAGQIGRTAACTLTVADVVAQRLERMKKGDRTAGTVASATRMFDQLMAFLPRGGRTRVLELTAPVLEDFESALREHGVAVPRPEDRADGSPPRRRGRPLRAMSAAGARGVLGAVRGLIRFAMRRGLIDRDPSAGYELPQAPKPLIETFGDGELALIYADADPRMADIWRFLTQTCLRAEEFSWLTGADVISGNGGQPVAIHVRRKTCPFTGEIWWPKHKTERVVPLSPEAAGIVAAALARNPGPWVFHAPDTASRQPGKWQRQRLLLKLNERLKASGIAHGCLHAFRHTGATFLAGQPEMKLPRLQKFLGHRDIKTTMRYVHTKAEDVAGSIAAVDFTKLAAPATPATSANANHTNTPATGAKEVPTQRAA